MCVLNEFFARIFGCQLNWTLIRVLAFGGTDGAHSIVYDWPSIGGHDDAKCRRKKRIKIYRNSVVNARHTINELREMRHPGTCELVLY